MAEAILDELDKDRFEALSAGSHPAGFVHPLAIEALRRINVPLGDRRSKSWNEFADEQLDAVITVCDAAAAETCPAWPGGPLKAHWSLPDPAYHQGTVDERIEFAVRIAKRLHAKIEGLISVDWSAPRRDIEKRLAFLAEI
jgi:arsenate reductase